LLMDPNVQSDERGGPQVGAEKEDSSNYLRQLRMMNSETEAAERASAEQAGAALPPDCPVTEDRRRSPRFRCAGSAEFRSEGSDVRMWGTLKDISLHGCYIEMTTTFPVGTVVDLGLEARGILVQVKGEVRVCYPFLGMGIAFREIEPGQQTHLGRLLSALAEQITPPAIEREMEKNEMRIAVAGGDYSMIVEGVTQFFEANNHLLSREEFIEIANRARRQ